MKSVKLEVEGITKRFGDLVAVDNVSFKVYEGEVFTLLGPSGCGKTTTLRIISGLETPDSGRVYIGGRDVTELPPQERDVCLVFQEYAVFPHMSVFDNIAFGLKVRKVPREELTAKTMEVAEKLGLSELLGKKAGGLGLSEKQRIALARCLAVEPEILLLDEPLTLADAKIRESMRRELRRLQRELGITMIYVTHDQLEAIMLSDRIAIMNRGKLLQVGSPREIYEKPETLFVAYFIGSPTINLVEGRLTKVGEKYLLTRDDITIDVSGLAQKFAGLPELLDREIVLGIRPEDLYIAGSGSGIFEGVVEIIETAGDQLVAHVKIAKETMLRLLIPLDTEIRVGEKVVVSADAEKIHVFDKSTEKRINLEELHQRRMV